MPKWRSIHSTMRGVRFRSRGSSAPARSNRRDAPPPGAVQHREIRRGAGVVTGVTGAPLGGVDHVVGVGHHAGRRDRRVRPVRVVPADRDIQAPFAIESLQLRHAPLEFGRAVGPREDEGAVDQVAALGAAHGGVHPGLGALFAELSQQLAQALGEVARILLCQRGQHLGLGLRILEPGRPARTQRIAVGRRFQFGRALGPEQGQRSLAVAARCVTVDVGGVQQDAGRAGAG